MNLTDKIEMRNRRFLAFFSLIVAVVFAMAAQNDAETEARADQIRLDEDYLFAERFYTDNADTDLMDIEDFALSELAISVNTLRVPEGMRPLTKEQLHPLVDELVYRSGSRRCVFLYIAVDKVMRFTPSAADNVAGAGSAGGPSVNPSQEEPSYSDDYDEEDDDAPEEDSSSAVSVNPGGVVQGTGGGSVAVDVPPVAASAKAQEVAAGIVARNGLMLGELGKLLLQYKKDGLIEDFGQVRRGTAAPGDTYLVVVDRSLKVIAILSPHSDGMQRDVTTGDVVDPSSFHNCGIVWFK